ncbi:MAG TPA: helix-turn-helix domain-containing protein [Candidatus Babeliales bacterium]|jgi:DNA-binding Xre family transcriptional regulator|nr:helix-turn-helix domain-containing protein [Candidatus Babeliales bacterium]
MKKNIKSKKYELKDFHDLMKKRLTKEEIQMIQEQAELEFKALKALQDDIANKMANLMEQKDIGFNELVERLDVSPAHIAKIQKGKANLTLASIARLFAALGEEPHLVLKK